MAESFSRRPVLWVAIALVLILLLAAALLAGSSLRAQRITGQQTVVVAPDQLIPGSPTALRVVVQDFNTGQPLEDAHVEVSLRPAANQPGQRVFQGRTDALGSADVRFTVPAELAGSQQLVVNTQSAVGSDELAKPVQIERTYKLLLTTDKPLYQPGQVIHVRSLGLSSGDLAAASQQPVEFTVEDPKGNKVFRQQVTTSDFGIASVDFTLASEVNTGPYKIVARLGDTESEKTVAVKPYVLPKFQIALATDRPYYLPGQHVAGSLQADYFFGKPVAGGEVRIAGSVYEVDRQQVLELTGVTDERGRFDFEFDLPEYFVSGAPEVGQASFGLEATVVDQAQHAEQVAETLTVAQEPLLIDVVAESGSLKPGVENVIYILTSYPNGAPAQTALKVAAGSAQADLQTGSAGLAEFRFTPAIDQFPVFAVEAQDAQGNQARRELTLDQESGQETVLLRPERAAYRVGDTLHVDVLASQLQGAAYLDIIREGQTLNTRALEIVDGRASADIDLDESLFGTLELHVYKVLRDASLVADTRLVIVDRAQDIEIAIQPDQETYRPGDPTRISFQTSRAGQPAPAALGLSIVDESVFALQEQEAGLAKLYFLLQAEILEPRYELHGYTPGWLMTGLGGAAKPGETQAGAAQLPGADTVAQAVLAANPLPPPAGMSLDRWQKERAIQQEQNAAFEPAAALVGVAMGLLGLVGLVISLAALARRKVLGRSLLWVLGGFVALLMLIGAIAVILSNIFGPGEAMQVVAAGVVISLIVGVLGWAIYAWRKGDRPLQILCLLLLAFCLALPLLAGALDRSASFLSGDLPAAMLWAVAGLAALLLAFTLAGAGFAAQRRTGPALLGAFVGVGLMGLLFGGFSLSMPMAAMAPAGGRELAMRAPAAQPPMPMVFEKVVEVSEEAPVEMAQPGAAPGQEAPRLRQFFPETLYWNPQVLTDDQGQATVELPMADSITTWRLSALASSQAGELGSATAGLRAFQDFFVDLDLPLYLTQNDQVSLPVAVFNYLPQAQQVRLVVEPQAWFELLDEAEKTLTIQSNDVDVVYFRIRAKEFGRNRFQVTAWGEQMSDAIAKDVQVLPDGKQFRQTVSNRLSGSAAVDLPVPAGTIPGTAKVFVKIYPGVVSQVVEGLQGMLRMPFG